MQIVRMHQNSYELELLYARFGAQELYRLCKVEEAWTIVRA